jgi:hypothetical protein
VTKHQQQAFGLNLFVENESESGFHYLTYHIMLESRTNSKYFSCNYAATSCECEYGMMNYSFTSFVCPCRFNNISFNKLRWSLVAKGWGRGSLSFLMVASVSWSKVHLFAGAGFLSGPALAIQCEASEHFRLKSNELLNQ